MLSWILKLRLKVGSIMFRICLEKINPAFEGQENMIALRHQLFTEELEQDVRKETQ